MALLAALFLPASATALNCAVSSISPSYLPDSAAFALQCDSTLTAEVSWDFGDGTELPSAPGQGSVQHAYAQPGRYTVFARVVGQPFAFTAPHATLHRPTTSKPAHSATLAYDEARGRVYCVNADNNSMTAMDARTFTRLKEIPVGQNPRTLAIDSLGRIWVANQADATLSVVDGQTLEVLHTVTLPYASRPYGICFAPSSRIGYVTLQATGALLQFDAITRQITGTLALFPTPRGIAITHDGVRILVTRFLSPGHRGEVADVRAHPFSLAGIIPLPYDSAAESQNNGPGVPNALSSLFISPDGREAWAPFKKDNVGKGLFQNPAGGPPDFESTVRTGAARIRLSSGTEDAALRLDFDNRAMAFAGAFDSRGEFAYIVTQGSNHTVVFDNALGTGSTAIEPTALDSELAPDGVVLARHDSLLFIHYFMSRQIGVYNISRVGGSNEIPRLALVSTSTNEILPAAVLRGKKIFYNASDPRMSRDQYMSCVVCHMDGGSDGRVWDFTHKGEGLRRTVSLLGRGGLAHGPVHWTANFDEIQDFEHDIRDAFGGSGMMRNEDFKAGTRNQSLGDKKTGLSPELDALAAYVSSLTRTHPSPHRNSDGSRTAEAQAGEAIFRRADTRCAECHIPPRYTDSELRPTSTESGKPAVPGGFLLHDVGTLKSGSGRRLNDTLKGLDTPTLLGIWENGPYLHDGSAATLMEVLTTANPQDLHGKTSQLSPQERNQLVAFLQQLDSSGDPGRLGRGVMPRLSPPLSIVKTGNGWLFAWNIPGIRNAATLRIFNASGTQVAQLETEKSADSHRLAFRWENPAGRPGIYLLQLSQEDGDTYRHRVFLIH